MPKQNRVTPFGEIVAYRERGTFMGNRGGPLHNAEQQITHHWASRRWIICVLEFKGRRRAVMTPGRYTELFFLDEATAMAAGHRPCAECRRGDFNRFKALWLRANPGVVRDANPSIDAIDAVLQRERIPGGMPRRLEATFPSHGMFMAMIDELPDGVFVRLPGDDSAYLIWAGGLHRWSAAGYAQQVVKRSGVAVEVLTPPSTVKTIAAGYTPRVHGSSQ